MSQLNWTFEKASAAEAVARTHALRSTPPPHAKLFGARLCGEVTNVLGAYQQLHVSAPVNPGAAPLNPSAAPANTALRRCTGGPSYASGEGILYLALILPHRDYLTPCPPGRILNRYVRGFLRGFRAVGVTAVYPGRECLTVGGKPFAALAWVETVEGAVAIECFIGVRHSASLCPSSIGKAYVSLESLQCGCDLQTIFCAMRDALASHHRATFTEQPLSTVLDAETTDHNAPTWRWSSAQPIPMGTLRVGLAGDATIDGVALSGEIFMHEGGLAELNRRLRGRRADEVDAALEVEAVFGPEGYAVEGLKTLDSLQAALESALGLSRKAGRTSH